MSTPDQQPGLGLNVSLASTLLALEQENAQIIQSIGGSRWRFGIPALDKELPQGVLIGDRVIGIAASGQVNTNVSLGVSITATHILDSAARASRANVKSAAPNVFVVTTPQNVTGTVKQLHNAITQRSTEGSASPAELLEKVSVMQYLNLAGLAEVVAEVNAALGTGIGERKVVLVQGMSAVVAESQRRSGAVQTAAVLAGVLANVRNLVRRGCGGVLVVLEVEAGWVPVVNGGGTERAGGMRNDGLVLESSFASSVGKVLRVTGVGGVQARLIEDICGCILVVHDGSGRVKEGGAIVEIVKGDGFGAWSHITS